MIKSLRQRIIMWPCQNSITNGMLKKRLRKYVPTPSKVRQSRSLRIFGNWVEDSNLWQLSRHTTARAFAIGLYCAMLPVPGQMIISVALAIIFTANVPLRSDRLALRAGDVHEHFARCGPALAQHSSDPPARRKCLMRVRQRMRQTR